MSQAVCPNCRAPRQSEHKFCPKCGQSYDGKSRRSPGREIIIISALVLATILIYNLGDSLLSHDDHAANPVQSQGQMQSQMQSQLPPPSGDIEQLISQGNQLMDQGQYQPAVRHYEAAIAIDSTRVPILVDAGACYHAVGDNNRAAWYFQRALALEPNHPIALFNMGIVCLSVADSSGAKSFWTRYLNVAGDAPQQQRQFVEEQLKKL